MTASNSSEPTFAIRRRLGPAPRGNLCAGLSSCPDVFELETGDFVLIGRDITAAAIHSLPPSAGCGQDERIILIPRNILVQAKHDIPDNL